MPIPYVVLEALVCFQWSLIGKKLRCHDSQNLMLNSRVPCHIALYITKVIDFPFLPSFLRLYTIKTPVLK